MKLSVLSQPTKRLNSFLNSPEDLKWLFETRLKSEEELEWIRTNTKSFIIMGNEDCPELIECYSDVDPNFGYKPFFIRRGSDND